MPSRQAILASAASALIVFIIMAATRPEPHTRFVAADGAVLPGPPVDRIIVDVQFDHEQLRDAVAKLAEQAKVNMLFRLDAMARCPIQPRPEGRWDCAE